MDREELETKLYFQKSPPAVSLELLGFVLGIFVVFYLTRTPIPILTFSLTEIPIKTDLDIYTLLTSCTSKRGFS